MICAPIEPRSWPQRRWWFFIALVFSVQVGLIFWLSDKSQARPRRPGLVPALRLAGNVPADLLALNDPTLFALPHRQGFSGLAWLRIPRPPFRSFEWSEDPRWLQISVQRLGAVFGRVMEPDDQNSLPTLARPVPQLTIGEIPLPRADTGRSLLRLEGDLARRRLSTPISLPSRSSGELLTISIVQVIVGANGRLASVPILLPPGSGDKDADDYALRQVKTARFDPVTTSEPGRSSNPVTHLTWGRMVFEWHTVSVPLTNPPPAGP